MNLTDTRGFVHLKEKGPEAADLYTYTDQIANAHHVQRS